MADERFALLPVALVLALALALVLALALLPVALVLALVLALALLPVALVATTSAAAPQMHCSSGDGIGALPQVRIIGEVRQSTILNQVTVVKFELKRPCTNQFKLQGTRVDAAP